MHRASLQMLVLLGVVAKASVLSGQEMKPVVIDGLTVRTSTAGLDARGQVEPVVVFEAGAGSRIETWASILAEVAEFAPLVAYDRAGIGGSDWDSLPPTPERIASRLRRVLSDLGVHPPFVLVGHSWGGALINQFADAYPDEVAGMVFIDPTDFTWRPEDEISLLAGVGMDSTYYEARRGRRDDRLADLPAYARVERGIIYSVQDAWGASHMSLSSAGPAISVVIASQRPVSPTTTVPFDAEAYTSAKHLARVERLRRWVRGGGRFVEAPTSEHYVHRVEPDLVVSLIREVVEGHR